MRRACKLDRNHAEIVEGLAAIGAKVQSLAPMGGGVPDLLAGFRGFNILLEVKDGSLPPSQRQLTKAEAQWHATWLGQRAVVHSVLEAQIVVINHAVRCEENGRQPKA